MSTGVYEVLCMLADKLDRLLQEHPVPGLAIEVVAGLADFVQIDRRLSDPDITTLIAVAPFQPDAAVWRRDPASRAWLSPEHLEGDDAVIDLGSGLPSLRLGDLYEEPDSYDTDESPEYREYLERMIAEGEADYEQGNYTELRSREELHDHMRWIDHHATDARRSRVSGPGMRAFINVCDAWGLTASERQRMLQVAAADYSAWVQAALNHTELTLDINTLSRISVTLGIYQVLRVLHASDGDAAAWLRRPHRAPPFGGRAPVELVAGGRFDAMEATLRFLQGAGQGFYVPPIPEVDVNYEPITDADIIWKDGND
jgi:Protein of unknown function (DUF2384)